MALRVSALVAMTGMAAVLQWWTLSMGEPSSTIAFDAPAETPLQSGAAEPVLLVWHRPALFPTIDGKRLTIWQPGDRGPLHAAFELPPDLDELRTGEGELTSARPGLKEPGETFQDSVEAATLRVSQHGGQLTEAEVIAVLRAAQWPEGLIPEALAVAWCESRWSPYASGDGGNSLGLFQLNVATWFRYAGEDPALWSDPVVNARVAWATYQYDIGRGYAPWKQWSCKPVQ